MNLNKYDVELYKYGGDILNSDGMNLCKGFMQHGNTSVFDHSCFVTKLCLFFVDKFNLKVNRVSLIRGSLLHDYFLYDWHISDKRHRFHGFRHGKIAAVNAVRDFNINYMEYNMILYHMFPLNFRISDYKEGVVLTICDKISACYEILSPLYNRYKFFAYSHKFPLVRASLALVVYSSLIVYLNIVL